METKQSLAAFSNAAIRRIPQMAVLALALLAGPSKVEAAGTWTPLTHLAPTNIDLMLLLPDGTVLAADGYTDGYAVGTNWYRLTPDAKGSYINGTWTTVAAMHDSRLYDATDVLPNGRIFAAGGYFGSGAASAEIYDPWLNTWTMCSSGTGQQFVDAESVVLPDRTILIAPVIPNLYGQTAVYDPATDTWPSFPMLAVDVEQSYDQVRASWVMLPDSSILTVDSDYFGFFDFSTNTERYIPSLNQWVSDAPAPAPLYQDGYIGSFFLLANSNIFCIGDAGYTALYTASGSTNAGSWVAGPDEPIDSSGYTNASPEAPEAMMANGHILCAFAENDTSGPPITFYEYDPVANTFDLIDGPEGFVTNSVPAFLTRMLDLPDGSVLFSDGTNSQLYDYAPSGPALAAGQPAITSITTNYYRSYHLTGTQINGISQGAAFEVDQMNSNYPLVRMTNAAGNVYYARTYNWSSTGVMTGSLPVTTEFLVPQNLPGGLYSLVVVANGNSSAPVPFMFAPDTLQISALTGFGATGPNGGPVTAQSANYTLTNKGSSNLNWTIGNLPVWLNVSTNGGVLAGGDSTTTVTISLDTNVAATQPIGNYAATVWFTNLTTGAIQSVPFSYQSTPLVINGGFEYGSFAYWQLSTNLGDVGLGAVFEQYIADTDEIYGGPEYIHSGNYAAQLGGNTALGYLSQTIPTVAGRHYALSFWFDNISSSFDSQFIVTWGGTNLLNLANFGPEPYTNLQLTVVASSSQTVLQFGFLEETNYFGLDDITLTGLLGPSIIVEPTNETVAQSGTATFTVQAAGTPNLYYQWQYEGAKITNQTNASLMLTNVTTNQDGSYAVVVTNAYGSITSSAAILTVIPPAGPSIVGQPSNQIVTVAGTAIFTVQVAGTPPFTYQWAFDGTNLAKATNATLTLTNVTTNQSGLYTVTVSDPYGMAVSSPALLTVLPASIVLNGGFETGDLTDWTLSGNTEGTVVVEGSSYTHSGDFGVQSGPVGSPVYISQALATAPGQLYLLSCWVNNPEGATPNLFQATWNGTVIVNQTNITVTNWTNFQAAVLATGASAVLTFVIQDNPAYLGLDDISVVALQRPSFLTVKSGAGAIVLNWSTVPGFGYQLQYTSDLRSNHWSDLGGVITASNNVSSATDSLTNSQRFYRLLLLP
jgi:hypothetical protein